MRPVDADALMRIHKLETSTIGKDWTVGDLATAIELAPTINAIPVEWLRDWQDEVGMLNEWWPIIERIITIWQEEQEAR